MSAQTQSRPPTPQVGSSADDRAFLGHPKGLSTLFFVELWERFSYYGMRAILLYFLVDTAANGGLGIDKTTGTAVVAIYGASVYLLSIIGGFTADRLFGARRSTLYGAVVIMAGHVCLAIPAAGAPPGSASRLVALGTGLLKPNVSAMVGTLYKPDDARRDGGFSIFYMSINIGSFFSPLVVGWLREHYGYHAGFSAAAVGMAIAITWFVMGRKALGPAVDDVPNPLSPEERGRVTGLAVGAVVAFALVVVLAGLWRDTVLDQVIDAISIVAVLTPIAYFTMMFRSPKVEREEKSHLAAYLPLWIGAMLFWMIFEQAAGKMALFASDNTVKQTAGVTINPEWFQSINPLAIVLLAPVFGWIWTKRAGRFPSTPMKFVLGVAHHRPVRARHVVGLRHLPGQHGAGLHPRWCLRHADGRRAVPLAGRPLRHDAPRAACLREPGDGAVVPRQRRRPGHRRAAHPGDGRPQRRGVLPRQRRHHPRRGRRAPRARAVDPSQDVHRRGAHARRGPGALT